MPSDTLLRTGTTLWIALGVGFVLAAGWSPVDVTPIITGELPWTQSIIAESVEAPPSAPAPEEPIAIGIPGPPLSFAPATLGTPEPPPPIASAPIAPEPPASSATPAPPPPPAPEPAPPSEPAPAPAPAPDETTAPTSSSDDEPTIALHADATVVVESDVATLDTSLTADLSLG